MSSDATQAVHAAFAAIEPDVRAEVERQLAPLFAEAREKGLWFHGGYHDLWFSPDELAAEQAKGKFIWGVVNWTLRDPAEKVASLYQTAASARTQADAFARRVAGRAA